MSDFLLSNTFRPGASLLRGVIGHAPKLGLDVLFNAISRRMRIRRGFRQLSEMSDWQLADIGLTRNALEAAAKGHLFHDERDSAVSVTPLPRKTTRRGASGS